MDIVWPYSGTPLSMNLHLASTKANAPLRGLMSHEMILPNTSEFLITLPLNPVTPVKNRADES